MSEFKWGLLVTAIFRGGMVLLAVLNGTGSCS